MYLINSPVVRAEPLRFRENGVRDVVKDVLLPWFNAYRFFVMNAQNSPFVTRDAARAKSSDNFMDKWILAAVTSLNQYVRTEMEAYRLYTVIPGLLKFVEQLTNWYVRFNRKRLKGEYSEDDKHTALATLYEVLFDLTVLMAPFTPFLCEKMYRNLRCFLSDAEREDSVHYLQIPKPDESMFDKKTEMAMSRMQTVIELARVIRDRETLSIKTPLRELVVIHSNPHFLDDVKKLEYYVLEEVNVRKVTYKADDGNAPVRYKAEPDNRVLGKRLGEKLKQVDTAMKNLSNEQLDQLQKEGELDICGEKIALSTSTPSIHHTHSSQLSARSDSNTPAPRLTSLPTPTATSSFLWTRPWMKACFKSAVPERSSTACNACANVPV